MCLVRLLNVPAIIIVHECAGPTTGAYSGRHPPYAAGVSLFTHPCFLSFPRISPLPLPSLSRTFTSVFPPPRCPR